jgi:hypothetical protein
LRQKITAEPVLWNYFLKNRKGKRNDLRAAFECKKGTIMPFDGVSSYFMYLNLTSCFSTILEKARSGLFLPRLFSELHAWHNNSSL